MSALIGLALLSGCGPAPSGTPPTTPTPPPAPTTPPVPTTSTPPVDEDHDGATADVDCDDDDPAVHPGATERCGGGDEDCDGLEDDEDPDVDLADGVDAWIDEDGDGWGAGEPRRWCAPPDGWVGNGDDCDDTSDLRTPDNHCGDADEDGLLDADEAARGTDPLDPDTDGDTIPDGAEVHRYATDPLVPEASCLPWAMRPDAVPEAALAWASGDLDGDGDTDLVASGGYTDQSLRWYENDGNGGFVVEHRIDGGAVYDLLVADIDQDGDLDLLGLDLSCYWDCSGWWLRYWNLGGGRFGPPVPTTDGARDAYHEPGVSTVFDAEGDGDLDLFVSDPTFPKVDQRTNVVAQIWPATTLARIDAPNLNHGDLDGDGREDLVLGGASIQWMRRTANGWDPPQVLWSVGRAADVVTDLDADGDVDVVVTHAGGPLLLENTGAGFAPAVALTGRPNPNRVWAADVDVDGATDLLIHSLGGDVSWIRQEAPLVFGPPRSIGPVELDYEPILVLDLEADGDPDVLRPLQDDTYYPPVPLPDAWVNDEVTDVDGDGLLDRLELCETGTDPGETDTDGDGVDDAAEVLAGSEAGAGPDADADGLQDLEEDIRQCDPLVPDTDGDGIGDAPEGRVTGTVPYLDDSGCEPWIEHLIDDGPPNGGVIGPTMGDLDGDGDADAVVGRYTVGSLEVIPNLGASFGAPIVLDGGLFEVRSTALADLDADGDPDVVARTSDGDFGYENVGGLSFGAGVALTAGGNDAIVAADLDLDGWTDLVTPNGWFPALGPWSFDLMEPFSQWMSQSVAPVVEDLDGNGLPDVVVSQYQVPGRVGWYRNTGNGTFARWAEVDVVSDHVTGVQAADVDLDGAIDLVVAGDGPITWYRQDAAGAFVASPWAEDVEGTGDFLLGDLDGDGREDVVFAGGFTGRNSVSVTWNRGRPPSRFGDALPVDLPYDELDGMVLSDVDGDGDPDVVGVLDGAEVVRWYENRVRIDTDADGLLDAAERCVAGSSEVAPDTDGDGHDDRAELDALADPTDPLSVP